MKAITLGKVVEFIQQKYSISLYEYQIEYLDNLIQGKLLKLPRCSGTSTLIKGYYEYLDMVSKDLYNGDFDGLIKGTRTIGPNKLMSDKIFTEMASSIKDPNKQFEFVWNEYNLFDYESQKIIKDYKSNQKDKVK